MSSWIFIHFLQQLNLLTGILLYSSSSCDEYKNIFKTSNQETQQCHHARLNPHPDLTGLCGKTCQAALLESFGVTAGSSGTLPPVASQTTVQNGGPTETITMSQDDTMKPQFSDHLVFHVSTSVLFTIVFLVVSMHLFHL